MIGSELLIVSAVPSYDLITATTPSLVCCLYFCHQGDLVGTREAPCCVRLD